MQPWVHCRFGVPMAPDSSVGQAATPVAVTTQGGFRFAPCRALPQQRTCRCSIPLNPPPNRPDPWTYDKSTGQYAQFSAWQNSPGTVKPPTFWIKASIDPYSTMDPLQLPSGPSPFVLVTVGNNSNVPAINALVQLSMSAIGIGRVKVPVASQYASIPAQQSVSLSFVVPPSFLNQQYLGVYVDITHPYDSNLLNNHAISMWEGLALDLPPVPPATVTVVNEFSTQTETISLTIIPAAGVVVTGAPGPVVVAPGQSVNSSFNLQPAPWMDGGTFLCELATVVGTNASGSIVGGLTIVGAVND